MMLHVNAIYAIHGVASIWSAHPYKQIVFTREVAGHVPLTFAAVLTTYDSVNESV